MKGEKQMIYKSIRFKADPFLYDLKFDDRITLVGGDSGAWLSSARVVRCWVKSRNERNPCY